MSVLVDPALPVETYASAALGSQRYFNLEEDVSSCGGDGVYYVVVARDREHAEQILRDSGAEFGYPSRPFGEMTFIWTEISDKRAAEMRCVHEERTPQLWPLNTYRPGDWFCSEW